MRLGSLCPQKCLTRKTPPTRRILRCMSVKRSETDSFQKAKKLIQAAGQKLPRLVVLDLDYTIWPFWCEIYSPNETRMAHLFPETRGVIDACRDADIKLAVASRSPTLNTAKAFLKHLGLFEGYFEKMVIVPYVGKDQRHFPELRKALRIEYEDMLFFDDEGPNIRQVGRLGVTAILVSTSDGVSLKAFEKGLKQFAANNK